MIRPVALAVVALIATLPAAAPAQRMSDSYEFLKAVKEADGNAVTQMLDRPGSTIVNTKEASTGDTALHIVTRRSDATYIRFLLGKGAAINAQDARGNTALLIAVNGNCGDCVDSLLARKANVNLGNASGETPLIRAVQMRNLDVAEKLLKAGANPDQGDRVAGKTARDYAQQDNRSPALTKLLVDAPKATTRAVSGPKM